MSTNANALALEAARLVWQGIPEWADVIEHAKPCPLCGGEPDWERDGPYSRRFRLACCDVKGAAFPFPFSGESRESEIEAVISWNEEVGYVQEALKWEAWEAEQEAKRIAEDRWVDEHLPSLP